MEDQQTKDAYSKDEAAQRLGIGYVTLHNKLLKTGLLRSVRVGSRVLIPRTEVDRFLSGETRNAAGQK
jgi:excisionase family DNA binding protein